MIHRLNRLNRTGRGIVVSPSRLLAAVPRFLMVANTTGSARPQIPIGHPIRLVPKDTLYDVRMAASGRRTDIQGRQIFISGPFPPFFASCLEDSYPGGLAEPIQRGYCPSQSWSLISGITSERTKWFSGSKDRMVTRD